MLLVSPCTSLQHGTRPITLFKSFKPVIRNSWYSSARLKIWYAMSTYPEWLPSIVHIVWLRCDVGNLLLAFCSRNKRCRCNFSEKNSRLCTNYTIPSLQRFRFYENYLHNCCGAFRILWKGPGPPSRSEIQTHVSNEQWRMKGAGHFACPPL